MRQCARDLRCNECGIPQRSFRVFNVNDVSAGIAA
jgi:hypothetical protein